MSDPAFDAALGVLFVVGGIMNLRNARRGFVSRHELITLGKSPIEPERLTSRMRSFIRYEGMFSLIVGALFLGIAIYRVFRR